ncbi:hypothetical protein M9434_004873 [Picochlorum sp. BPE23]|nr:hypothetical protein M9434_004873 [Picochlorum sp. BPE23]
MSTPGSTVSRPKPWERQSRVEGTSSPAAEGAAKPWEVSRPASSVETVVPESSTGPSQQPAARPWEAGHGNQGGVMTTGSPYYYQRPGSYGLYGNSSMYGNGGMYGNSNMYGNSMYGNSMYGGGMYGSGMYGPNSSMYGSSMYGPYSSMYGMNPMGNMYGRPMPGGGDPNAPSAWQAMLGGIGSMVHFFGRLSFLVDENAHAVHFFISALLQLLDRFGSLYGELARFILRLLGLRTKESSMQHKESSSMQHVENPKTFDATWQNTMRN